MIYKSYKNYIDDISIKYPNYECFSYINKDNLLCHLKIEDVYNKINLYGSLMREMGIKFGDKVCLISNNLIHSQITFICSTYNNVCVVLIDPNLPLAQIQSMISDVDIRLILTDKLTYQKIDSIIDCKALDITNNFIPFNDLKVNESKINSPDEMAIIFSSGTTSTIKPIVLSYDSIINSSLITAKLIENRNTKYSLCLLPVYHISGIISLFGCLYINKYIQTVEYFNLNNITKIFGIFNPNNFIMTPIVIEKMIDELEIEIKNKGALTYKIYNLCCNISLFIRKHFGISITFLTKPFYKNIFGSRLKLLVCSSSQLPQKVIDKINAYGIDLVNTYASTECGNPITWTFNSRVFDNSVGRIDSNPNVSIELINIDDDGAGEICVKTNSLMKCYYNDPCLTNSSFTKDGYFKTGDLGRIKNDFLYIVGRVKETIKLRNGKKLSSTNLENLLEKGCPTDNKVIICGYSTNNNEYDDIYAFFKDLHYSSEDKQKIKRKLLDYNSNVLKSYPIKEVYFVNNVPTNTIGKVKKYELTNMINNVDNNLKDKSSIINILSKYINIDSDFDVNKPLNNLGIDSLSMYSIVIDIKEKYNLDIIPFLTSNTTTQDLINSLGSRGFDNFKLRKVKSKEIKEIARYAAESFYDYPLYEVFYPDIKTRRNFLFLNCWFTIYQRQNYSYINEDKTIYIAYKKPGDKEKSLIGLFLNFDFIVRALATNKLLYGLDKLHSYSEVADKYKKVYYNTKTDNYIQNMFVKKGHQGDGLIFKALKYLDDGRNIFAETHSEQNMKLFRKMGIDVMEIGKWQNTNHYVLKKIHNN